MVHDIAVLLKFGIIYYLCYVTGSAKTSHYIDTYVASTESVIIIRKLSNCITCLNSYNGLFHVNSY